jgi:hypothetical protein
VNALTRGLLVFVLAVGALGFGAVGLCGGYFTVSLLTDLNAAALLLMSLPCLVFGFSMAWICARRILRLLAGPREENTP